MTQESRDAELKKLRREIVELKAVAAQNRQMAVQIAGLTRLYTVLRQVHEAAVTLKEPTQLCQRACRIAVEDGLFLMAWVGLAQSDSWALKPIAYWAIEEGALEEVRDASAEIAAGPEAAGGVIRDGKPWICRDIEHDPRMASCREKARRHGCRAVAAFPLMVRAKSIGAMVFYAPEPDFFEAENLRLLESLAAILSFALEAGEKEKQRRQAEKALEESEARYRELVESANSIILRLDPEGRVTFINAFAQQFFGYSPEEIIGRNVVGTIVPEMETSGRDLAAMIADLGRDPERYAVNENENLRRGGERVWVAWTNKGIFDDQGNLREILCIGNDITANRLEDWLRAHDQAVQAMGRAIEMRDPYTAGHQQRVTRLACALAQEMGIAGETVRGLRLAGLLHDIGKIVVPAELLSKPGKLRNHELEIIKDHPYFGYEILKGMVFPWPVADIIYQHHERLNGSGYPQGLAGEEILLEARILAVADTVEAMGTHRPYRPAFGIAEVLEEIGRNAGALYDPAVAEALFACHRKGRLEELLRQEKID